jgi:hypothetical protein
MITFQSTPFGTVHVTASGEASREPQIKGQVTRQAKARGLVPAQVTRRSHVIGDKVTVFTIYRKAV